ncbi:hypothetical protein [Thalassotalea piscium]|uniref:Type III secretory pathway component EscU n=1 Tax=Thalassotalea piscium TaxID=1230533 RepID=A0A7X0NI62_9GAMM|nr:hypothetical protein [Thalassotalea piscium]MBB6543815.1 type III secretory pathway component EscU [Thalassotalea piscium]
MHRAEDVNSSGKTDECDSSDNVVDERGEAELSALTRSLEQYLTLMLAQLQQTKESMESRFHLALRAILMSVMALLAFIIVSLCLWFSVSALIVVGLVSLEIHWLIATFVVLLANVGLAWYLLLTSRDLSKSIRVS